jgi:hypothetical protein
LRIVPTLKQHLKQSLIFQDSGKNLVDQKITCRAIAGLAEEMIEYKMLCFILDYWLRVFSNIWLLVFLRTNSVFLNIGCLYSSTQLNAFLIIGFVSF